MHALTHLPTPVVSTTGVPLWPGSFLGEPGAPFYPEQAGLATGCAPECALCSTDRQGSPESLKTEWPACRTARSGVSEG